MNFVESSLILLLLSAVIDFFGKFTNLLADESVKSLHQRTGTRAYATKLDIIWFQSRKFHRGIDKV